MSGYIKIKCLKCKKGVNDNILNNIIIYLTLFYSLLSANGPLSNCDLP